MGEIKPSRPLVVEVREGAARKVGGGFRIPRDKPRVADCSNPAAHLLR